jgi:hypothetical protein
MSTSKYPLNWYVVDRDNEIYEAAGGYVSEEDGPAFHYRIRKEIRYKRIVFVEASDAEMMLDESNPRTWQSVHEAKAEIQKDHDVIMDDIEKEGK